MLLDCLSPFNRYFVLSALGPVLCTEILLSPHFLQTRHRSIEFKR